MVSAAEFVPPGADLEQLRAAAAGCRGCELWEDATQTVFSAGSPRARLAMVGEQPGDQEDRQGLPFVGPAGRLLQKAVDDAGLDRGDVYVSNAVKHFRFTQAGPGKRRIHQTPELRHITACKPWLAAELRVVDPSVIVALGATAAKALLGPSVRVTKDRGVVMERETSLGLRRFVVTTHPSAVLRVPDDKRDEAYVALVADLRVAATVL
ncbi:MAG: UdgX family uracil-DNA binding protein [Sporichthyaceae bacterium]|nr:UdgX family uracil-DNA binding protein [Sporichthyaceae bacterium]